MAINLKYPVLLIHGLNGRDHEKSSYWGRIPEALQAEGVQVYFGGSHAWTTIEYNGAIIAETLRCLIESGACEKVNIIAHSKGGLEARYVISQLEMAPYVASLTTIATPHRGLKTLDVFCRHGWTIKFIAPLVNLYARIFRHDTEPDAEAVLTQLSAGYCRKFNEATPDAEGVFYQSYGSVMERTSDDWVLFFTHNLLNWLDGPNDGMVPMHSTPWGEHHMIPPGRPGRGVSHNTNVDLRKRTVHGFDAPGMYLEIVRGLEKNLDCVAGI